MRGRAGVRAQADVSARVGMTPSSLSRLNFRDLGGLSAGDGRRLRHRMLYRSEGPASFTSEHRRELAGLGIRLICDLRRAVERQAAPNDWSGGARLFNLVVHADLKSTANESWDALRHDPSDGAARAAMKTSYRSMPAALHPRLAELIDALNEGAIPALIHCTAGKDRTGVLVALLLTALGIDPDDVLADYLRSTVFAETFRRGGSIAHAFEATFGFAPSEPAARVMVGVDREYLDGAFAALNHTWGSVDNYFMSAGVCGPRLERLRATLLAA
jgi:protein-tyrosine phosphatase